MVRLKRQGISKNSKSDSACISKIVFAMLPAIMCIPSCIPNDEKHSPAGYRVVSESTASDDARVSKQVKEESAFTIDAHAFAPPIPPTAEEALMAIKKQKKVPVAMVSTKTLDINGMLYRLTGFNDFKAAMVLKFNKFE